MSTLAIMTRLQLNWSEVPGIGRAHTFEPSTAIDLADFPAVFPVLLGRMTAPVPATSAGQYIVERQYIYRVLVGPAQAAAMDSGDLGAYLDEKAVTLLDAPTDYFMAHPRLATAALGDLGYLSQDVKVQDSAPMIRPGPGGAQYCVVEYTFTIAERRFATRIS